jgi:hypothetical protein
MPTTANGGKSWSAKIVPLNPSRFISLETENLEINLIMIYTAKVKLPDGSRRRLHTAGRVRSRR